MLKSLVNTGVFSEADYDAFISGVSTVSGQLARDQATWIKQLSFRAMDTYALEHTIFFRRVMTRRLNYILIGSNRPQFHLRLHLFQ